MRVHAIVLLCFALCGTVQAQFVAERGIDERERNITNQVMNIAVYDAVTKTPLPSDFSVNGLNPRKPIDFTAVADTALEIRTYRQYTVTCVREGYMLYSEKFWPAETDIHNQNVALKPLAVGLKTDMREITFMGDKTEIYPRSKPALDELIRWLQLNKTAAIAITGHVNGPDNERSTRFYQKASLERAKAVRDYLVENGIAADRLEIRGAGNTEMIYPDPATDWQNDANRRIEIEVIGL
jgi:outer membrane protein OmpA-like peptidoglycan-associated protein